MEAALTKQIGKPTSRNSGSGVGCGDVSDQFVTFGQTVTAYFKDGKFAGWDYFGDRSGKLRTAENATVGTTANQLHSIYGERLTVGGPTAGGASSFFVDGGPPRGVSGRLSRELVVSFHAGATCAGTTAN